MEIYSTIYKQLFLVLQLFLESNSFYLLYEHHYYPTSQVPKQNSLSFLKHSCHDGTTTETSKNYPRHTLFHCPCTVNLVLLLKASWYLSAHSPLLHSIALALGQTLVISLWNTVTNSLFLIGLPAPAPPSQRLSFSHTPSWSLLCQKNLSKIQVLSFHFLEWFPIARSPNSLAWHVRFSWFGSY